MIKYDKVLCCYDKIVVNVVAYVIPGYVCAIFLFTPHDSYVVGLTRRRSLT